MAAQTRIESVSYGVQSDQQREARSKARVHSSDLFSGQKPVTGGLYDPRMGTTDMRYSCSTCGHGRISCPGHPGHVELPFPLVLPFAVDEVRRWLRVVCLSCSRLMADPASNDRVARAGAASRLALAASVSKGDGTATCPHCRAVHPKVVKDLNNSFSFSVEVAGRDGVVSSRRVHPFQIARVFGRVADEAVAALGRDPALAHPSRLLMRTLQVPPVSIRPAVRMSGPGGHGSSYHDITGILRYIVNAADRVRGSVGALPDGGPGAAVPDELAAEMEDMQQLVYDLLMGSSASATQRSNRRGLVMGGRACESVARRIPRKAGRIRRNIAGRRVWSIGRNTISGRSSLAPHQVGIPESFARALQVVETVTPENLAYLTRFFLNGRRQYPGASRVWRAATRTTHDVEGMRGAARLEPGDRLHRDTITGDLALFNRQPSLERSSMNVHTVVVMRDMYAGSPLPTPPRRKTFAFNVTSTPLYNADFDGDEMNLVVIAIPGAQAEGLVLAKVANAFISTKSSTPVLGMVQDSTVGSFLLSVAPAMGRLQAMELFERAVAGSGALAAPDFTGVDTIDGRGALSMLLRQRPVSLRKRPKWFSDEAEAYVRFRPDQTETVIDRGTLVTGVLDSATVGSGARGGLFHRIARAYGPEEALRTIFALQQMTIAHMNARGFTTSIADMVVPDARRREVEEIVAGMVRESELISARLVRGEIVPPLGMSTREFYERLQLEALKTPDEVLGPVLSAVDPETNGLFQMVATGSKGNFMNIINIVAAVGQVTINSRRMQPGAGGRTLAYYPRGDMSPEASGFVRSNYILGLSAAEHFFGSMNGRNDLTSKALATASTGYANRKSVMSLQSAVTDALRAVVAGRTVQLLYGDDGLDARQVEPVEFATAMLSDAAVRAQFLLGGVAPAWHAGEVARLLADRDAYRRVVLTLACTTFSYTVSDKILMAVNVRAAAEDVFGSATRADAPPDFDALQLMHAHVGAFCDDLPYLLLNERQRALRRPVPPPLAAAVSHLARVVRVELGSARLHAYGAGAAQLLAVFDAVRLRFQQSLISPGSAVGLHASQAVSEPLTQYMLDSHHRSVAGGTNKSGIVRPEEIMSARPVAKERSSEMLLRGLVPVVGRDGGVRHVPTNDKALLQELADSLKLLTLDQLLVSWEVLYERLPAPDELRAGAPGVRAADFFPAYAGVGGDWGWMRESVENDPLAGAAGAATQWCCRFVLDRMLLVTKSVALETIITRLRSMEPAATVLHSTEGDVGAAGRPSPVVVRVWLDASSFSGSRHDETTTAAAAFRVMRERPLRGVPGILEARVEAARRHRVVPAHNADGSANAHAGQLVTDNETYVIRTTGTNLHGAALHTRVDVGSLVSSSIGDTIKMFGIEAGRARIIHEIRRFMGGRAPNSRHLILYADQMTVTGRHTPFEGSGIASREPNNVMLRAAAHGPIDVFVRAALGGLTNPIYGLLTPLMVGSIPKIGAGSTDLLVDEEFVAANRRSVSQVIDSLW